MTVASIFAFLSWLHCVCVLNSSVRVLYVFFLTIVCMSLCTRWLGVAVTIVIQVEVVMGICYGSPPPEILAVTSQGAVFNVEYYHMLLLGPDQNSIQLLTCIYHVGLCVFATVMKLILSQEWICFWVNKNIRKLLGYTASSYQNKTVFYDLISFNMLENMTQWSCLMSENTKCVPAVMQIVHFEVCWCFFFFQINDVI